MTTDLHDDLVARLRAADPATGLEPRLAGREALTAARRRRSARRAGGGALATVAAALAIALAPFGGGSSAPSVLASAAHAAQLPPNSIVVTTTDVAVRTNIGKLDQRRTTWVRVGGSGQPLASRTLNVKRDGSVMSDDVSHGSGPDAVLESLDPRTGDVTTQKAQMSPGLLFQARALLRRAEREGRVEPAMFDGRKAYRVSTLGVEEEPLPGDREDLLLDAETFEPLVLHRHEEGRDVDGDPFAYDYTESVVKQETLPDTPANRQLLRVGT